MPMHDWTRVEAGIYHAFHHQWISALSNQLNAGCLPDDYYALPEQQAAGFGPDVLTLQTDGAEDNGNASTGRSSAAVTTRPQTRFIAETTTEFYQRKKSSVVVRHVSGDRIVAIVEVISPGNKASDHAFSAFVGKACELLEHRIHLLILDPFPPGPRDPNGVHSAIWERYQDEPFALPAAKPLTFVAYECDLTTRAYIEPIAVGDELPSMPLFLAPEVHVPVFLEATYDKAFRDLPRRWRSVLEV